MRSCAVTIWALILCVSTVSGNGNCGEESHWKAVKLPSEAAGAALRGICFVDAKNGWIVGDKGLCLATANGGETWQKQPTGSDATLRCVRFNDALTGFICGDGDSKAPKVSGHMVMGRPMTNGSMLATVDGGKSWKQRWVPGNFEVWCIEISAAPILQVGNGWDAHLDGDITRSTDAGATWTERRVFRALSDIRAVDAKRWIAAGSPVSVGFTGQINDPAHLAKDCRALFSKDGGNTWTPSKGSGGQPCLRGLLVKSGMPALAVGDQGALLSSDDAGENWMALKSSTDAGLRAICADPAAIVAVGERGIFIISTDGGKTWRSSWVGQSIQLYSVSANAGMLWAAGENGSLLRANAKDLAQNSKLPAPPPAPVAPVKAATAFQRSRVRAGDFLVYSASMKGEGIPVNAEWQVKLTVASVQGDEFELSSKILKGTPPAGVPKESSGKGPIADIEDYSQWEIGKPKEDKEGMAKVKTERLSDETIEVKGQKIKCVVIKGDAEMPGGAGQANGKTWFCATSDVPITGMVKVESVQIMALPTGGKATITTRQELIDWGRGKEP